MVLVVANRLTLDDLDSPKLPNIAKMLRQGSVALISPNCPRPKSEESVLLTAATGTPCTTGPFLREFFDSGDFVPGSDLRAEEEYAVRTGRAAGTNNGVFLGLGPAQRVMGVDGRPVPFGLIGDSIHRVGLRTCAIGNADSDSRQPDLNRAVAVLASDSRGIVDVGVVGGWSLPIHGVGFDGNVGNLFEAVRFWSSGSALTVVNYGLSTRLDDQRVNLSDAAYAKYRANMLSGLDDLIGKLISHARSERSVRIALVSFSPSQSGPWNRLTPLVIYSGDKQGGLLTSSTTRTPGLIAASDFAPTLLAYLGVSPVHRTTGAAAGEVTSATHRIVLLGEIDARVATNTTLITPLLAVFAALGGLALTVAAILIAFSRPISRRVSFVLRFGMLIGASACLAMLLAVLAPAGTISYTASSLLIAVGLSTITLLVTRNSSLGAPVRLIFAATIAAVLVDALFGSPLVKFALPSSYQLDGFRYYGIGNEYGAALIAMSALLALFSPARWRLRLAAILGIVTIAFLGAAGLGSNYGAAAAAVVAFGLILVALRRGSFGFRHIAALFVLAASVAVAFAYADWRVAGASGTHGGKVIGSLGFGPVLTLIARKSLMNLHIAGSRVAARAFTGFVPFIALWFWGVQPRVGRMLGKDKNLISGLWALIVGAAAALVIEDSGVVMAAYMVAMTVLVLVYSLVEKAEPCQG